MRIEIDTYPKVLTDAERLRVSNKVSARFSALPGSVAADKELLSVVRPLEDICRHCAQRAPIGKSKYCRQCVELMARIDGEYRRNAPGARVGYILLICFIAVLVYWSLSGWMDLSKESEFQRSNPQISREAK